MALELTTTARILSEQTNIEQQIILEIDGIPFLYGAIDIVQLVRYGDEGIDYGDPGLVYGGLLVDPRSRPYIQLGKTSFNIKQQIAQDKGGATSVQKVAINLVDKDEEVTKALQPGNHVPDPLGRQASVYLNFNGGLHPEDSIKILTGIVDTLDFGAGNVNITITHPDDLKRTEIFSNIADKLSSAIDDVTTTIPLDNASGILESLDAVTSFVRINDEVIEIGSIIGNDIVGATRGALGTTAASHDIEDDVTTIYRLEGPPIDLSLKLLMSSQEEFFIEEVSISSFEFVPSVGPLENAVFFAGIDIEEKYGVTPGDFITITGATEGANNVSLATVGSIISIETGSYVILPLESLVFEEDSPAEAKFKSRFNTLADGAGLSPINVDVPQFTLLNDQFGSSFFDYDFFLKDTVRVKEFIDQKIFYPSGLFSIPRKGKTSVSKLIPPLADKDTKFIDETNTKKAERLKTIRTTNKNFYNAIVYKFEESLLDDKLLRGDITLSTRSTERIKTRTKPLTIEASGVRDLPVTLNKIKREARRYLDRYQFAAESIEVEVNYKTGFAIEVGDAVVFGSEGLQISDNKSGTRNYLPRIFECVNKAMNIKNGAIKLSLLDTAFGLDARFGTIGPSSQIDSGATTTRLPLKKSFSTQVFEREEDKWEDYINEDVRIRSVDFTFDEEVRFTGFDPTQTNVMILADPLSVAPSEDFIVEHPTYPFNDNPRDRFLWKAIHCFFDPQVPVVSGTSGTVFDVSVADATKFSINQPVRIHNEDYTIDSTPTLDIDNFTVVDISGTVITLDRDIGFTPDSTMFVDLIGFIDGGAPYAYV